ncbi:MAG: glycoside hydrolase family 127 protein [Oscillospiraceae bacterium]|jgi:DUF1680 family protein|nr:glycoside hydrolase family 127 protein [Oscillospiraceae bacterium]
MKTQETLNIKAVTIRDGFWSPVQQLVMETVIPYQYDVMDDKVEGMDKSHAIENFRVAAGKAEGEFRGMVFQDSDLAKWLEAAAYALALKEDAALEEKADGLIALIEQAQEPDGYLNTYFTLKEPGHKWQNLAECHELYCAGHMMEAAVAYRQATGKDRFLSVMRKNADLICARFGTGEGQVRGVPGHQEVELGLLRMYEATGEKRYLDTALYFINERGRTPEVLSGEIKNRGWFHWSREQEPSYNQRHLPVREQKDAAGHSVRAVYMVTAMAELAALTEDRELADACGNLWRSIVDRRMYITGGVGSTVHGEAFSSDYELPNDLAYAETCASIGMAFFARRMLELCPKGEYADILEKELYNGILSGMQMDGKRFFYVNPLETVPNVSGVLPEYRHALPRRPEWYGCACCPPNLARLIASLGQYAWGESEKGIYAHIYLGGQARFSKAGGITVDCESGYPWKGDVRYTVRPKNENVSFFFAVHIPGWCGRWMVTVNGKEEKTIPRDGYAYIDRIWRNGDVVDVHLEMEPVRMYANANVRAAAGCVALTRGPVVYCFEETDNGGGLAALRLPRGSALVCKPGSIANSGVYLIETEGVRIPSTNSLYSAGLPEGEPVTLRAVPYYAWSNRQSGGMRVWMVEGS